MKTHIISIGDELLIGQVVNTNASWLAEQLNMAGYETEQILTISDNQKSIREMLENLSGKAQLVVMTGGLGPTKDDITKSVICDFLNCGIVFNADVYENIKILFSKRGIEVSETNRKQAEVPAACKVIQNENGTAPGLWFEKNNTIFIALPGVPFEMKSLISGKVLQEIATMFPSEYILQKTVHIYGIPESHLSDILEAWENKIKESGFNLAYLPQPGIIRLRISFKGEKNDSIIGILDQFLNELNLLFPDNIFGYDNDSIESVVGKLLADNGLTVSAAESCTGGKIASMVTSVPGSSQYFKGSLIAYSNDVKIHLLNITPAKISKLGAVSKEVVEEMATGALHLFHSDFAIATSGIAGPEGGTPEKPVGTAWIAIATLGNVVSEKFVFGNLREVNIARTSVAALCMLRKIILENV